MEECGDAENEKRQEVGVARKIATIRRFLPYCLNQALPFSTRLTVAARGSPLDRNIIDGRREPGGGDHGSKTVGGRAHGDRESGDGEPDSMETGGRGDGA